MATRPSFLAIAEGQFGVITAKTAVSAIRYFPNRVVGVLDSSARGRTVQEVLGFGGAIPIVRTFEDGLALRPEAILIGTAPRGGRLPAEWKGWLETAIDRGLEVWSGLHTFLSDDPDLAARASAGASGSWTCASLPTISRCPTLARAWWTRWWCSRWAPTATRGR